MITIPTVELVEALAEAIPFAAQDKDAHWHGVLIEWDGDALHVSAYDTLSGARITWTPGDGAEAHVPDELEHTVFDFGGDDEAWRVFISVPHAKEIVKTFKLPAKHHLVPLRVKASATGSNLIVERNADTGQSQHFGLWPNDPDRAAKFPDIVATVETARPASSSGEVFSPYRLGLFGAAARYGVLELRIGANGHPTVGVAPGRFAGFLYPANSTAHSARPVEVPS